MITHLVPIFVHTNVYFTNDFCGTGECTTDLLSNPSRAVVRRVHAGVESSLNCSPCEPNL